MKPSRTNKLMGASWLWRGLSVAFTAKKHSNREAILAKRTAEREQKIAAFRASKGGA